MKKTIFSAVKITAVFLFFLLCLTASGQTNQQITQETKPEENTRTQQPETPIASPEIRKKENTESVAVPSPTFDYLKDLEERKIKDTEVKRQTQNSYPTPQPLPTFDFIGEAEKMQRERELEQQPLYNDQNPENQSGNNSNTNLTTGTSEISNTNTEIDDNGNLTPSSKLKNKTTIINEWKQYLPLVLFEILQVIGIILTAIQYKTAKKSVIAMTTGAVICLSLFIFLIISLNNESSMTIPHMFGIVIALISLEVYAVGKLSAYIVFSLMPNSLAKKLFSVSIIGISLIGLYLIINVITGYGAIGLLFGFGVIIIGGIIAVTKGSKSKEEDLHGSAKFAEKKDFKEFENESEPGAFILAPVDPTGRHKQIALPRSLSVMHGLILGGSGTGKSRGYFMPNCAEIKNTSLVVTDPKSELWNYTSGFHRKALRFAPNEPEASYCFNWIPLCEDARMSELCARAIMTAGSTHNTDQFWIDAETAFLSAIFSHTATLKQPTPLTAYRLFTRQKPDDLLQQLLTSPSYVAQEQAIIFEQTDARIKGAIVPAIASRMQFMRDKNIQTFTSAESEAPDFGKLRHTPTAVYWCLREQDIARLRPLTSLFFTVLLEQIAGEEIIEGISGTPITLMLDEFANLGKIPDFETTISLARGRGVALWLGVQSLSQLTQTYGSHTAQTIMSNCSTKIALHGLDYQTAEHVSKSLGEQTISHSSSSINFGLTGGSIGSHSAKHRRPLLTADEVMRIGENEAIARTSNKYPMKLYKGYYDKPPKTFPITTSLSIVQNEDENPENEILI